MWPKSIGSNLTNKASIILFLLHFYLGNIKDWIIECYKYHRIGEWETIFWWMRLHFSIPKEHGLQHWATCNISEKLVLTQVQRVLSIVHHINTLKPTTTSYKSNIIQSGAWSSKTIGTRSFHLTSASTATSAPTMAASSSAADHTHLTLPLDQGS